jgi:hypothetical protein
VCRPSSGKGVLIRPSLVEGWKNAEDKEKQLIASGYLTRNQLIDKTDLSGSAIKTRTKEMELLSENTVDASTPMIWRHPYSGGKGIYYHPSLVDRWKSEKKASKVLSKGGTTEVIGIMPENGLSRDLADKLDGIEQKREAENGIQ